MQNLTITIKPRAPEESLTLTLGEHHSVDWYTGPYEVTPIRQEQVLLTDAKTMRDDVIIHEIPYYETANPYGTTYVIGE